MVSRRSLLKNGAGLVAVGTAGPSTAKPMGQSLHAQPKTNFLLPSDFAADATGETDAQPALQRAIEVSAREGMPLLINGTYRLAAPLQLLSNANLIGIGKLQAAHPGALFTSGQGIISRVSIDGLRLEALPGIVDRAIEGKQWQYARLNNLRLTSAGGKFRTGFYFTNVAYWNSVSAIEAESVQTLFDVGDANNLILNDINWCRLTDIGMRSFLMFHAPCGSIHGRGLSIEGVFRNTTLIRLDPACENIDLEFLRVEGSNGSTNTTLIDFNGAQGNSVRLPPTILGLFGDAVRKERGNFILNLNRDGLGATHLGRGQVVAPLSDRDPSLEGALSYNDRLQRLRAYVAGARSIALSPAVEPLDMNGHTILNVARLQLQSSTKNEGATLSVDSKTQALQVAFANGSVRHLAGARAIPVVRGSRREGEALASLLKALDDEGVVVDQSTR